MNANVASYNILFFFWQNNRSQEHGEASWGMLDSEQYHFHTNLAGFDVPTLTPEVANLHP